MKEQSKKNGRAECEQFGHITSLLLQPLSNTIFQLSHTLQDNNECIGLRQKSHANKLDNKKQRNNNHNNNDQNCDQ